MDSVMHSHDKPDEAQTKHQNEEERMIGVVVGATTHTVFQKLMISWAFCIQPCLGFTENGLKNVQYSSSIRVGLS